MKKDRWVSRWCVPSSRGSGQHIVAQDAEGNFACSCIGWTRHVPRRDCRHITEVKEGHWPTEAEAVMQKMEGKVLPLTIL